MKKGYYCAFVFLIILSMFAMLPLKTKADTVARWTKYADNPLDLGLDEVVTPWVIYDGLVFKMWYSGATGLVRAHQIYYATSLDGIAWTPQGLVLERGGDGSWEEVVRYPVVLFDGTHYKMWYLGTSSEVTKIGYATSTDGIVWTKHPDNPVLSPGENGGWDDWSLGGLTVFFDGIQYKMWYQGSAEYGSTQKIGVATSADGVSWTKYSGNPVLIPGPDDWDGMHVYGGPVERKSGIYKMWYSGHGSTIKVGLATSADGFSWLKFEENPVLDVGSPGAWDSRFVMAGSVVEKDGGLMMWYWGSSEANPTTDKIGLATASARLEDFFLHSGASLDNNSPTATTAKYKDSPSIKFSGGNPWKEIGVWTAPASLIDGWLEALSGLDMWLGLKNSDDQGTNFDLRAEVYKNGVLVASGETYLIKGVTRNPDKAIKVTVSFGSFSPVDFNGTNDTLSLRILTRIGTDGNGKFGGGHSSAVGLRLYFDAVSRPAMLAVSIA